MTPQLQQLPNWALMISPIHFISEWFVSTPLYSLWNKHSRFKTLSQCYTNNYSHWLKVKWNRECMGNVFSLRVITLCIVLMRNLNNTHNQTQPVTSISLLSLSAGNYILRDRVNILDATFGHAHLLRAWLNWVWHLNKQRVHSRAISIWEFNIQSGNGLQ